MRILVDTNVFLDYFLKRENFESAKLFFKLSFSLKNPLYISSMSFRDIEYVAHRVFHNKEDAKRAQMDAYKICYKVLDISADDAINSLYEDDVDFEDCLLKEAAEREMIDVIVTNNVKDFRKLGFPALCVDEINSIYLNAKKEKTFIKY